MPATLLQTRTQIEADLLISRLRAAGLHPCELRVWPHVTLAGANLFYAIEVPPEEIDAANQVIGATTDVEYRAYPAGSTMRMAVLLVLVTVALGMLMP